MPATPIITAVDQADNTGAIVTVAGSDAGSTNSISVWKVRGVTGGLLHVGDFSRVSDGDIDMAVSKGAYLVVLKSSLAGADATGDPIWVNVTSGTDELFTRILDRVVAVVQTLDLSPHFSPSDVIACKIPLDGLKPKKGVFVHPTKESVQYPLNNAVDFGYVFVISTVVASDGDNVIGQRDELNYRERIKTAFIPSSGPGYNPFAAMNEVYNSMLEPAQVLLPEAFLSNWDVSSVAVRVMTRVYRNQISS